jgi:spermidine synthase
MRRQRYWLVGWAALLFGHATEAAIVFELTSPYHHIRVTDEQGIRTLSFDGSRETRMSLLDPSKGHFEYTEYFHMPWLWHESITNVLMIGLGGGSTQRAFQRHHPGVTVETVEIDPAVYQVAQRFFQLQESPTLKVRIADGRVYLRRSDRHYDLIIMDAYTAGRYGSFIPYHLVTEEFFRLANDHLTTNGVLAYNVIGTLQGWRADILGAVYKTMKAVFPQVYLFPSTESQNVVLIGTKSPQMASFNVLHQRATNLISKKRITFPSFRTRLSALRTNAPASSHRSPILTDDYAPVDGLLSTVKGLGQ